MVIRIRKLAAIAALSGTLLVGDPRASQAFGLFDLFFRMQRRRVGDESPWKGEGHLLKDRAQFIHRSILV